MLPADRATGTGQAERHTTGLPRPQMHHVTWAGRPGSEPGALSWGKSLVRCPTHLPELASRANSGHKCTQWGEAGVNYKRSEALLFIV